MSLWLVQTLRIGHILAGSFWMGVAVFNVAFLTPAIRASGPAGGPVMGQLVRVRRLPVYMNGAALLTVLTGLPLYWWRAAGFRNDWAASASGWAFGVGGVAALLALLLGYFVIGRAAARLGALSASAQPEAAPTEASEIQRVQAHMSRVSRLGAALIVFSAVCMAVGRYV